MKIGDKVRVHKKSGLGSAIGLEGIVTEVKLFNPNNPIEEHGTIEIKITYSPDSYYLPIGELEHFVYYNWQDSLEIIQ